MWNIYPLIKSEQMRLEEENKRERLNEIIIPVEKALTKMEQGLNKLESCSSEEEISKLGNDISANSIILTTVPLVWIKTNEKLTSKFYDKVISLLQKSYDAFNEYSGFCFDIFAESTISKLNYIKDQTKKHQPELIKNNI